MNNVLVIIGHGNYATGVESTIKAIVGPTRGVSYIDFLEQDSSEILREKALKIVEDNKGNNIVFICDILGGTPFNTAVRISLEYKNIGVVAGCNITSIIETIMKKDSFDADLGMDFSFVLEQLTNELISKTKESVFKYKNIEIVSKSDNIEDGI